MDSDNYIINLTVTGGLPVVVGKSVEDMPLPSYIFDNSVLGSHRSARQSHVQTFAKLFGGSEDKAKRQEIKRLEKAMQQLLSAISAG